MNENQKLSKFLNKDEKKLYNELVTSLKFLIKIHPYIKTDRIVSYGVVIWQDPLQKEFPSELNRLKSEIQELKDRANARYTIDEYKKGRQF